MRKRLAALSKNTSGIPCDVEFTGAMDEVEKWVVYEDQAMLDALDGCHIATMKVGKLHKKIYFDKRWLDFTK